MKYSPPILCCCLLAAGCATPLHLTYRTEHQSRAGDPTVLSATVETLAFRTDMVSPEALRLQVECGVRESRERKVIESESVRFKFSESSLTGSLMRPGTGGERVEHDFRPASIEEFGALCAIAIGTPLIIASVDLISLTLTAPVTLTAGALASGDREASERFDFRYRRHATTATLTDLGTGSSITLDNQPEDGWLIESAKLDELGFLSHSLLLESEGHAKALTLPDGFLASTRTGGTAHLSLPSHRGFDEQPEL